MAFEDIIGADLALGEETATFSPSLIKAMAGHQDQVLRALAERNASALVERKPQKSREFPLGVPETLVAGNGGTEDIVAFPQVPFRGERLLIPSDIAGLFSIDDIRVGKNSQLVTTGPLPARCFSEVSVGVGLHLDTAQVSQQITLRVRNISGQAATFRGMLIGRAVE
jgi:hypothetical protein